MKLIRLFADIFNIIFNYKVLEKLKFCKGIFFTRWISKEFSYIGKDCFFYGDAYLKGTSRITIDDGTILGRYIVLTCWSNNGTIKIGKKCNFGQYNHITCTNNISIGNNVLTGRWVTICDNSHGTTDYDVLTMPPIERPLYSKGPVVIEDDVWIGDKVTILSGVTLGRGSVIGANSVVTSDVPPYSIVAGIPAKIIKKK